MLTFKKITSIINIFYGLGFVIIYIICHFHHIPTIIPFTEGEQYQIIHFCEGLGFLLMFLAGVANLTKIKILPIVLTFFTSCIFLAIIFMVIITFNYSFSFLLGYIIPAIISLLLSLAVESEN